MAREFKAEGEHTHLYMRQFSSGVLSIDLCAHLLELPEPDLPVAPLAREHSMLTDMMLLKWFDVHGCNSAWDVALHLGGPTKGYTDAWVLQRYCYIVDQLNESQAEEATPAPPFIVDAVHATKVDPRMPTVFIGCSPEPEPEPELPATPPPTEPAETRPVTPEKQTEMEVCTEEPAEPPPPPIIRQRVQAALASGRRKWTQEADEMILAWVGSHGQNWRALARHMGGRQTGYSDDAVRNRYMRITGIKTTKGRYVRGTPTRGPKWSQSEDEVITQ